VTGAPTLTRYQLAAMIDHTLLAPEATPKDIGALCAPDGKPATATTLTKLPATSRAATVVSVGDTHTA